MYGGLEMIASKGPSPATGSSWSPSRKSMRSRTPSCAAFRLAIARASSEISMATKRAAGWWCAEAIARQPEPVPDIDGMR